MAVVHLPDARDGDLREAFDVFLLEKRGDLVSPATLSYYRCQVIPLLDWLDARGVRTFAALDPAAMREYRAHLASTMTKRGRPLEANSILTAHKATKSFLRWAAEEKYQIHPRLLTLKRPRVPLKDMPIFHVSQIRTLLAACSVKRPQEALIVRTLIGSGIRASELCGLSLSAPDGLSDLMTETLEHGRAELRIRWDGGAKGRKTRRVPIVPKLAVALRKYAMRSRPTTTALELFISFLKERYTRDGIKRMMDRLQKRVLPGDELSRRAPGDLIADGDPNAPALLGTVQISRSASSRFRARPHPKPLRRSEPRPATWGLFVGPYRRRPQVALCCAGLAPQSARLVPSCHPRP